FVITMPSGSSSSRIERQRSLNFAAPTVRMTLIYHVDTKAVQSERVTSSSECRSVRVSLRCGEPAAMLTRIRTRRVRERDAVFPRSLDRVHRCVGRPEEALRVDGVLRKAGDADGHAGKVDSFALERGARLDGGANRLRDA